MVRQRLSLSLCNNTNADIAETCIVKNGHVGGMESVSAFVCVFMRDVRRSISMNGCGIQMATLFLSPAPGGVPELRPNAKVCALIEDKYETYK